MVVDLVVVVADTVVVCVERVSRDDGNGVVVNLFVDFDVVAGTVGNGNDGSCGN